MAVYRCKSPFAVHVDGRHRVISGGALVDDSDPVFKGREHLFERADEFVERVSRDRVDRVVEAATAEPGELRQVSKPKRAAKSTSRKTTVKDADKDD